jgi:hypothetical protein
MFPICYAVMGLNAGVATYQQTFEVAMADMCRITWDLEKGIREFLITG